MIDLSQAIWRKARRSAHNGGCVEIAANLDGVAAVRDSKRPEGGAHVIGRDAFAQFLADVKKGRYDLE
jgi:Mrp family chromosome partitioning ATPase